MILVTGATGRIGRQLTTLLVAQGARVRAMVRDPARARTMLPSAVEIVAGDYRHPAGFATVLADVEKVFLLQVPHAGMVTEQRAFLEAAKMAGVKHVVRMSSLGASPSARARIPRVHGVAEKQLESVGLAWTHLRPSFFMQNLLMHAPQIASVGRFALPTGNGAMGWIDTADIAAVAAVALTQPGHEGRAYLLTGPQALSHGEVAQLLTEVLGRPVVFEDESGDEFVRRAVAAGMDAWMAEALNELYALVRAGLAKVVTPTVSQLLGRPARTMREFLEEHRPQFQSATD
ncbi:MAG: SDR family oxidoreductase [Verrucomicrobiae bacterium]|nr:SDR family oxidoreductase [Verrucomicrobiae bacterium]MDW8344965.1 SDR family oxidoreductase [Verrucomicrobiae bacterium]